MNTDLNSLSSSLTRTKEAVKVLEKMVLAKMGELEALRKVLKDRDRTITDLRKQLKKG
jgi:hypothetical protein